MYWFDVWYNDHRNVQARSCHAWHFHVLLPHVASFQVSLFCLRVRNARNNELRNTYDGRNLCGLSCGLRTSLQDSSNNSILAVKIFICIRLWIVLNIKTFTQLVSFSNFSKTFFLKDDQNCSCRKYHSPRKRLIFIAIKTKQFFSFGASIRFSIEFVPNEFLSSHLFLTLLHRVLRLPFVCTFFELINLKEWTFAMDLLKSFWILCRTSLEWYKTRVLNKNDESV